jgi:uncharacterized protein (TIGR03437 family)
VNSQATSASLFLPMSVVVDKSGNVFFVDYDNVVLRSDAQTGLVTAVAGNGTQGFSGDNGPATSAQLSRPVGLALDSAGNLYIADAGNNRVRKVSNGVITTFVGGGEIGCGGSGSATSAGLYFPTDVAFDSAGNLYIGDAGNGCIRKVSNGVVTTVAGNGTQGFSGDNGPATSAQLNGGQWLSVALDAAGSLYITDTLNQRIRKVSNGTITTIVGNGTAGFSGDDGPATSAQLNHPQDVIVDPEGNLLIVDSYNHVIRKVANGIITTVTGTGIGGFNGDNGPPTSARLNDPSGVAMDTDGNLYIADNSNNRIREVSNGVISTIAGNGTADFSGNNGPAISAQLSQPQGIAVDSAGNLYVADYYNSVISKVMNGMITTVAGNGTGGFSGDDGPATSAQLNGPVGIAVDTAGNLYIAENGPRVRKVSNGVITTFAGTGKTGFSGDGGPATSAQFENTCNVAVDTVGNVYIADCDNNWIRKVSNGIITTVAGNGTAGFSGDSGAAINAQLDNPSGLAVDSAGSVYIADSKNERIRKISNGIINTMVGNGINGFEGNDGPATSAELSYPSGVALDSAGNLYIADLDNSRVRKVSNGVISSIAGGGPSFGDDGPATSAQLHYPTDVAVNTSGNVFVSDQSDNRIRLLTPNAVPAIKPGGIVPNDSTVAIIQSGSWVSLYGSNLASGTFLWNADFPTSLGGVSVAIDNKLAYLWYVSPTQINLQVPNDTTTGLVSVAISTGSGATTSTVTLAPYGPSFSLLSDGKHAAGEIATPNGTGAYGGGSYDLLGPSGAFAFNTRPVAAGETLVLYGVGFGPTTPAVPAGQVFTGAAPTNTPVTITIGGVQANVMFAGITEAGLYQFNLVIPTGTGSGDQALLASVSGVLTPSGPVVTVQ